MKKWIGRGDYYCTRCGARLLQGGDCCPRCGRNIATTLRATDCPDARTVTEREVLGSKAFRVYQCKNTFVKLLWAVALAACVPWLLMSTGQIDLDETEGRVVAGVLCGMFLLIGIGSCVMARRGREWRQKAASEGKAGCIACGFTPEANDVFCGKCGCAIIRKVTRTKPRTEPRKAEAGAVAPRMACAARGDGEIAAPGGEMAAPAAARTPLSAAVPTLEMNAPSGEMRAPGGEIAAPATVRAPLSAAVPTLELDARGGEMVAPGGEMAAPATTSAPLSAAVPTLEMNAPATARTPLSAAVPTLEMNAPGGEITAPATASAPLSAAVPTLEIDVPTLEIHAPPDACVTVSDEPPAGATSPPKAASSPPRRRRADKPRAPATQSAPNSFACAPYSFACAPPTLEKGKRPHAGVNLLIGLLLLVFVACFLLGGGLL